MLQEPARYRPFALLAFGLAAAAGVPLGMRALGWLYLGWPAPSPELVVLHAQLQTFGFFATLIVGVAPHLLARFTGRDPAALPARPGLFALLLAAPVARLCGLALEASWLPALAAALQAIAFAWFALHVWRTLDPPPLAPLRRHLTASTLWLMLACGLEAIARLAALMDGGGTPAPGLLRAAVLVGLVAGVIGWVLGVLVRAGPMFVADWTLPPLLVGAVPWRLGAAAVLVAAGEGIAGWRSLALLGEAVAYGTVGAVAVVGGVFRTPRGRLPMLSRSAAEARLFRLAAVSAVGGALGAVVALAMALTGRPPQVVADAARHLVTVGFLTGVVAAMTYRLIPVLERVPLPWPGMRAVTFWLLLAAVLTRTLEIAVPYTTPAIAPLVGLSGLLAWLAIVTVAATLITAVLRHRRSPG